MCVTRSSAVIPYCRVRSSSGGSAIRGRGRAVTTCSAAVLEGQRELYGKLCDKLKEVERLSGIQGLLSWDEQVQFACTRNSCHDFTKLGPSGRLTAKDRLSTCRLGSFCSVGTARAEELQRDVHASTLPFPCPDADSPLPRRSIFFLIIFRYTGTRQPRCDFVPRATAVWKVMMPAGGAASRGNQKTALAGIIHEKKVDVELGDLLGQLKAEGQVCFYASRFFGAHTGGAFACVPRYGVDIHVPLVFHSLALS